MNRFAVYQNAESSSQNRVSLTFFLGKAPYSIAAAALPGFVNYAVILWLTHSQDFAAAGSYRFVLSVYGLIGLAAMAETGKIYIRSLASGEKEAFKFLWFNRLIFAAIPLAILACVYCAGQFFEPLRISKYWIGVAAICAVIYLSDFYKSYLQACGEFRLLLSVESAKYGCAAVSFYVAIQQQISIELAALSMLGCIALANIILSFWLTPDLYSFPKNLKHITSMLRSLPASQARTYSFANMVPASLEHLDKLLVGWFFGLQWLGIYTLAFSTGRLIYNIIKPAIYVYYRRFVDHMPGRKLLLRVAISGTTLGISCAGLFWLLVHSWPAMAQFEAYCFWAMVLDWFAPSMFKPSR